MPDIHRERLPVNEFGRQPGACGGYHVAELAVDRLRDIFWKQQKQQASSLLVRCARHIGQLCSDGRRGEFRVSSARIGGKQNELVNAVRVIQS